MTRAVSILQARTREDWSSLAAITDIDQHTEQVLDPFRRIVKPTFEQRLKAIRQAGIPILVRYARRSVEDIDAARDDLSLRITKLSDRARTLLYRAQRHGREGVALGLNLWDPIDDVRPLRALLGSELLMALPHDGPAHQGSYLLHPDLPPAPVVAYDFTEAVMPRTDDLPEPGPGTVDLLHDLASLAASLLHHPPRRTLSGTLDRATTRKLGKRLGSHAIAKHGKLEDDPRWARALGALEALGAVSSDPIQRELTVEPDIEDTLAGSTPEATDRMLHRLIEPDLQAAIPAIRAALEQAKGDAIDEVIFFDELAAQDRQVVFARWHREGSWVYPNARDDGWIPFDRDHFDEIEVRLIRPLLARLQRIGLIVRADGVFAATPDGRLWAERTEPHAPPIWVSSDLEILVPPRAITPWERYQLERLGATLSRDVVDRYKLRRDGLEHWLATHDLEDALALLKRRCPGVPANVVDTLTGWTDSVSRFVLTRGVLRP